jgi:hypothetical protein
VAELLDRLRVPIASIGLAVCPLRFLQRQPVPMVGFPVRPLRLQERLLVELRCVRGEVQPGSGGSRRDDCCGDSEDPAAGSGCGLRGAVLCSIQVWSLNPQDHQSGDQEQCEQSGREPPPWVPRARLVGRLTD